MTEASPVIRPEHPSARSLGALVEDSGVEVRGSVQGVHVTGVSLSSREVLPGDLYVALRGDRAHGAAYTEQARDAGAVAVVTDAQGAELAASAGLPILVVDDPRLALGDLSAWVYQTDEHRPALFGVTGTNGKTSTSYLLDGLLRQLGLTTGLSTTAERRAGDLVVEAKLTTPEAPELHALLARMRESEVRAAVIEVSSHALGRHRIDGLLFDVVGFTNLSHDHLDEYADMDEYFAVKLQLFHPDHAKRGVASLDTPWGARVLEESRIPVTTVALAESGASPDWTVTVLEERVDRTVFRLSGPEDRELVTSVPLLGRHMASNAGLAIVMLVEAGFDLDAIGQALGDDGIDAFLPGRIERVSGERGPALFVDFGHSPEAFRTTLEALRRFTEGGIVMVFSANGDRDHSKREAMGAIPAELADHLIVTDLNPRTEDPASIRAVLLDAARATAPGKPVEEIADPTAAIRRAVELAGPGDSILWAGPGHQEYREIGADKVPYSARSEARLALQDAGWEPA